MKKINSALQKIPALLSSKVSIAIYFALFLYLVVFALLCVIVPGLSTYAPSSVVQLIMGNYIGVLSALGASLAAGTGVAIHASVREIHKKHDAMQKTIDSLHEKLERIEQNTSRTHNKP